MTLISIESETTMETTLRYLDSDGHLDEVVLEDGKAYTFTPEAKPGANFTGENHDGAVTALAHTVAYLAVEGCYPQYMDDHELLRVERDNYARKEQLFVSRVEQTEKDYDNAVAFGTDTQQRECLRVMEDARTRLVHQGILLDDMDETLQIGVLLHTVVLTTYTYEFRPDQVLEKRHVDHVPFLKGLDEPTMLDFLLRFPLFVMEETGSSQHRMSVDVQ